MRKVIIITRTWGYIENGVPIEGREKFAKAILNRNNPNNYSDKNLRKFLSAREFIKQYKDDVDTESENRYKIKMELGLTEEEQIKILLGCENFPNDDDIIGGDCCYVSFQPTDHDKEIILVLWDKLIGVQDEVKCFELFIEQICKDCNLSEDGSNYLYIHDVQFTGKQSGDKLLMDKTTCQSESKTNSQETSNEYAYFNKWFNYVALFAHDSNNMIGIFKDNILQFRFGSPFIVDQRDAERNSNTFSELREKSDNIVEQYKERYQLKN